MQTITIGLISDTHDMLRPEAIAALQSSDYIIHAGDIGSKKILKVLEKIAPVTAVRGNCEEGSTTKLPESAILEVGEVRLFVIHDISELDLDFTSAGYDVVVSGHTHCPEAIVEDGVLFVNPGSAGPNRPGTVVGVGRLVIEGEKITPELIKLETTGTLFKG